MTEPGRVEVELLRNALRDGAVEAAALNRERVLRAVVGALRPYAPDRFDEVVSELLSLLELRSSSS